MTDFETAWLEKKTCGHKEIFSLSRGFLVDCASRILDSWVGLSNKEKTRLENRGLKNYLDSDGKLIYYSESPTFAASEYMATFKSFANEHFQPFDRVLFSIKGEQVHVRLTIHIKYEEVGQDLYYMDKIYAGLVDWSSGHNFEEIWQLFEEKGTVKQIELSAQQYMSNVKKYVGELDSYDLWGIVISEKQEVKEENLAEYISNFMILLKPFLEEKISFSPEAVGYNPESGPENSQNLQLANKLSQYFLFRGLYFSPELIATFYTALKTKGFVILSGISGTGKTKLAQAFASFLCDEGVDNYLLLPVRPDWKDSKSLLGYYNPLIPKYEYTRFLEFILQAYDEQSDLNAGGLSKWLQERLKNRSGWLNRYKEIWSLLSGKRASDMTEQELELLWKQQNNGVSNVRQAPPLQSSDDELRTITAILQDKSISPGERFFKALEMFKEPRTPYSRTFRALAALDPENTTALAEKNRLKKVLQYLDYPNFNVNKIMKDKNSQELDRIFKFLQDRAQALVKGADKFKRAIIPWLIWEYIDEAGGSREMEVDIDTVYCCVLDEMNLARIEYYFSDFLSVLESGRREDGFTKEPLRLQIPPDITDDENSMPPAEIYLPPNLYFVGTMNVDETTYTISPKVLDRAFVIECNEVDFDSYSNNQWEGNYIELSDQEREVLINDFTRKKKFAVINKNAINQFIKNHPDFHKRLNILKQLLEPFGMHFAYRVYDEIMMFLINAEKSVVMDGFGDLKTAFDISVLMKVLPKFYGPRGRLEEPLLRVLSWTIGPFYSVRQIISFAKELRKEIQDSRYKMIDGLNSFLTGKDLSGEDSITTFLTIADFTYPRTALKTLRMLDSLYTMGFASFV